MKDQEEKTSTTRESAAPSSAEGVLELKPQGNGHLRQASSNFLPGPKDVRVPTRLISKYFLKEGQFIKGPSGLIRRRNNRRGGQLHNELQGIDSVNGFSLDELPETPAYSELVSEHPDDQLLLAQKPEDPISMRVMDLVTPIGRGQRGLIVASPKTGKTILLEQVGCAIAEYYPEIHLFVLLIDERPEEVTHMRRSVNGQVIASTSDGTSANHLRVARLVLERSRRLVEHGDDVVILLDSITRLGRAANREQRGRGKTMSGGIDSRALEFPRQLFGAARNVEDGGSLTILGTALVDTGSQMDEVIFQEFKGTGNMELVLDRKLAESRVFPAIDISGSGTRKEELLLDEQELPKVYLLRRALAGLKPTEAMSLLLDKMKKTESNKELLEQIRIK